MDNQDQVSPKGQFIAQLHTFAAANNGFLIKVTADEIEKLLARFSDDEVAIFMNQDVEGATADILEQAEQVTAKLFVELDEMDLPGRLIDAIRASLDYAGPDGVDESMDGDHASALESVGWGDEDIATDIFLEDY